MPFLEDLLFGFDDLHLNSPSILPESLQMACLRRLEINSGHPSVIRGFLLSTIFPQIQKVYIHCSSPNNSDLNDYSAAINASLSLIAKGDFGRLDHAEFDSNRFMMSQLSPADRKSGRTLEFFCPHTTHGRLVLDAMAGISALPCDRASDFVLVACHARLSSQNLTDLFGRLPRLESLRAPICSEVIDSLKIPPLHPSDLPIPFPRLQKITLDEAGISYDLYSSLIEELSNSLMTRREHGSGVKELCLNLELTKQQAESLQPAVVDLDFWGIRMSRAATLIASLDLYDLTDTDTDDEEFEEHWLVDDD
ncbi:hypothetical protein D9619_010578 [Psilocybe cf. subviscida]|uniref:Uncharacterized protein n=1 Tax=Psilocybe cf. subviscida TaxID=2480587 RepID=A0A8H5ASF7_9AGAR|nr:hypothetical protein D9619_010578 [Psilocybe cf. subviscida]